MTREYKPTPSRSTSTCPTSTAGASWSGSRTTWPRGTSRSASSRPTRPATGRSPAGALAFVAKPIQSRDVLDELLDHLTDFVEPAGAATCWWSSRTPARREQIVELARPATTCRSPPCADGAAALRLLGRAADRLRGPRRRAPRPATDGCSPARPTRRPRCQPAAGDRLRRRRPRPATTTAAGSGSADVCTVRQAHSPDALLDLAAFFLHRPLAKLPEAQRQRLLEHCTRPTRSLAGKKVLIVDDDMRNIFALSSVLEEHDMVIVSADNGRDAIRSSRTSPDIDIVLMDIMMPEMDGMDTMREIRKIPQLQEPADHRGHGQGHEGRPREVHRGRRLGLPVQAGGHRAAAGRAAGVAASLSRRSGESDRRRRMLRRGLATPATRHCGPTRYGSCQDRSD